jgi:hypothetical protein
MTTDRARAGRALAWEILNAVMEEGDRLREADPSLTEKEAMERAAREFVKTNRRFRILMGLGPDDF